MWVIIIIIESKLKLLETLIGIVLVENCINDANHESVTLECVINIDLFGKLPLI